MQIFVKTEKHSGSDEDQKTATLDGTLAEEVHKAPAKGASRATSGSAPAKSPPPFACSCQPNQLGRHLRG